MRRDGDAAARRVAPVEDSEGLLRPDNRLYLRFKPSSLYYIAFSVDSMYVGNGYVLKRNDIEVVVDPSASL